jgi:two-component system C4-dicarboxylate transport response regulator DctD
MTNFDFNVRVFLVDDNEILLKAITQIYELDDMEAVPISDPVELVNGIDRDFPGVIVTDVRMPGMDGFELFSKVNQLDSEIPVIFITGHADVPMVLETLRKGAFDFFSKPIDSEHLLASTRRAIKTRGLVLENRRLKELAQKALEGSELIGETSVMQQLRATIQQVAQADIDILIEGETGTGKEVVAALIHQWSNRAARPFISINCAALPESIAEIELLGAAYDPHTPTQRARTGKIEASNNGTLFLDEIESLSPSIQGQLLPVVEKRKVTTVGGDRPKSMNLRIIASSQIDLSAAAEKQDFRADLLYRLNTVRLRLPPLRDRKEDVPLLFAHFISKAAEKFSKKVPQIGARARGRLIDYDWPGNVRELKNFAYSLVLGIDNSDGKSLTINQTLPKRIERFEVNTICSALEQTKGDVKATLELLGIPRKTFYDKLSRHEIDIKKYRNRAPNQ